MNKKEIVFEKPDGNKLFTGSAHILRKYTILLDKTKLNRLRSEFNSMISLTSMGLEKTKMNFEEKL